MNLSLFGFARAAGQNIDDNPKRWLQYEIQTEAGKISIAVPPGHRFDNAPRVSTRKLEPGKLTRQIFSAQYDYGWFRWRGAAQFEVFYTLVRLPQPLAAQSTAAERGAVIARAVDADLGRDDPRSDMVYELVTDERGSEWLHGFTPAKSTSGYFAKQCDATHFLLVTAGFYGTELRQDQDWVERRKALTRKLLAYVSCGL